MRTSWTRIAATGGLLLGLAVTASACQPGKPIADPAPASPSITPSGPLTPSDPATPSGPVPSTRPASSSSPGSGACTPAELTMKLPPSNSAKFQESTLLVLTNTGRSTCTVSGYPALRLLGPDGHAMPTVVQRQDGPVDTIRLAVGQAASAQLIWNKYEGQGTTCPPYPASVSVTLPGQDTATTIPWVPDTAGSVCGGTIKMSPIVAGTGF